MTLALATWVAVSFPALAVTIEHRGVECIVANQFPRLEARVTGDAAAAPKVVFRASGTRAWYQVTMKSVGGERWEALLPKPSPATQGIDYYIAAGSERTPEYHPVVSTKTYCENKGGIYAEPVDSDQIALTIGLMEWGQAAMPSGFLSDGIVSVMMPDGTVTAMSAASSPAGGGAGGAGSGEAASSGHHVSTWAILGGVAVAGGIALAAGGGDDDDDDGGSSDGGGSGGGDLGTGVLTFRLYWSGSTDVDLHVVTPNGCEIYFGHRSCGAGQMDHDANAGCGWTDPSPVENIYWESSAPRGTYHISVVEWDSCGQSNVSYTLQVLENGSVVRTWHGTLTYIDDKDNYTYSR